MKGARLLLFATVPVVVTASVHLLGSRGPRRGRGGRVPRSLVGLPFTGGPGAEGAQGAKAWAERSEEAKSAEDKAVSADLPPGPAAPAKKELPPAASGPRRELHARLFLNEGNLDLRTPLEWQVYGETYKVP